MKKILFILLIAVAACNNSESNKTSQSKNGSEFLNVSTSEDEENLKKNVDLRWIRKIDMESGLPENNLFIITWTKGDSSVSYQVNSKIKDKLIPSSLRAITLKSNKDSIEITFKKNYSKKLPQFSPHISGVDRNSISNITIIAENTNHQFSQTDEDLKAFDSVVNIVLTR